MQHRSTRNASICFAENHPKLYPMGRPDVPARKRNKTMRQKNGHSFPLQGRFMRRWLSSGQDAKQAKGEKQDAAPHAGLLSGARNERRDPHQRHMAKPARKVMRLDAFAVRLTTQQRWGVTGGSTYAVDSSCVCLCLRDHVYTCYRLHVRENKTRMRKRQREPKTSLGRGCAKPLCGASGFRRGPKDPCEASACHGGPEGPPRKPAFCLARSRLCLARSLSFSRSPSPLSHSLSGSL